MESLSSINVNVDSETKKQATDILKDLGLNMSTFINMALRQVIKRDGIPFEVKNPEPREDLLDALKEGEDILNGKVYAKKYHSVKELIKDLDDET